MKRYITNVIGLVVLTGSSLIGLGSTSLIQAQDWRGEIQQRKYEEKRRKEKVQKLPRREGQQMQGFYLLDHTGNIVNDGFIYQNSVLYDDVYSSPDYKKGYQEGLNRGRNDARTYKPRNPNNSTRYRKGNAAYRTGFEHGFYQSVRRYRGY